MLKCVLVSVLIIAGFTGEAQHRIAGKVLDKSSRQPMAGASVVLENTYSSVVAGQDGTYLIKNLKTGNYTIGVTYLGYLEVVKSLRLERDTIIDFELEQSPVLQDEVIITATRADQNSPTTYLNIPQKEIEKVNFGQDMPYMIQSTPSVVVTSDAGTGFGYTGLRIRGTDLTRINVTINGIPMNDSESQGVWWVDAPDFASSVDNIQVQRGVGTSTNGAAAFGASLNIQTQKPSAEPYAEVNGDAGSFNSVRANFMAGTGLIKNKWSFDARFSTISSDGYIDRASSNLNSYFISGGYYGKKNFVKFTILSGKEKTYLAWDGVPGNILDTDRTYNGLGEYIDSKGNISYYDNETDNYKQDHYQLFYSQDLGKSWILNSALHYTKGAGYYEEYMMDQSFSAYGLDNAIIGNDTITTTDMIRQRWLDNDFFGTTLSINHDNHRKLQVNLGGSWNYYEGDHFGKIIWSRVAVQFDNNYQWYTGTGIKTDLNTFGKIHYQMAKHLNLYGDLQYRRIDYRINGIDNDLRNITQSHIYNFINPKLGLFVGIDDRNKAYASFAVANREPNRDALVDANPAKPYPTPETLYDAEAGYSFATTGFEIDVNLYYMYYHNQLVLTGKINDVGDPIMENVPESYRAGIELSAGAKLLRILDWQANATFSRNKILNFTEYVDNWDEWPVQIVNPLGRTDIAFSPDITANNIFDLEPVKNLHLELISKYVGKQYLDNTSSEDRKLDPYFVNDLLASYLLHPGFIKEIVFQVKINNFTNTKYESNAWVYRYYSEGQYEKSDGFFPQAGINFLAGISLKF
jgi:iron complex outermembrane receptor protein